jgi:sialate O-acetylesterase
MAGTGCTTIPALPTVNRERAEAAVHLPAVFGDHMVLQRDRAVPVWGKAAGGAKVEVWLGDGRYAWTVADETGKWKVSLAAMAEGGPHRMVVASGGEVIAFEDVLVGEVWLASGQSNMGFELHGAEGSEQDIAQANWPRMRRFQVPHRGELQPLEDVEGQWQVTTPENAGSDSAVAFYFGRVLQRELDVPVGMIESSVIGTRVQPWTPTEVYEKDAKLAALAEAFPFAPNEIPSGLLYNGMIAPVVPYGIRGAIWYQGESNMHEPVEYRQLFAGLIEGWRDAWGQGDFPFLFVQLAPFYGYPKMHLARLWESQLQTVRDVPGTGMAVITDVGHLTDIHPPKKREVGERLAAWALGEVYGCDVVASGPLYRKMEMEGDAIRLFFDYVDGGLMARDGALTWFSIAGDDRQFVAAEARIEGQTIVVHGEGVEHPVAVRFGWDNEAQPNLFNEAGLPASPFRTDDWAE